MIIEVFEHTLEPGSHFMRKTLSRKLLASYEIPDSECMEPRPDWGEYSPIVTFPAIERALRTRGALPRGGPNTAYYYHVQNPNRKGRSGIQPLQLRACPSCGAGTDPDEINVDAHWERARAAIAKAKGE